MIAELWKEKSLDAYLAYFHKEKKKFNNSRLFLGAVMFLVFALSILLIKKYVFLLGTPLAFLFGYKILYFNLMLNKKSADLRVSFLFPQFLQTFIAMLSSSGNVYQTLKATIEYTGEPLRTELEKLVKKIEKENNRDDYLAFAEYVGSSEAYMIMDMIYQFSEFGVKKEAITELQNYIQSLQENKIEELIAKKMLAMDKFGLTPIFISLFLFGGFASVIFMYYMQDVLDALNVLPQ